MFIHSYVYKATMAKMKETMDSGESRGGTGGVEGRRNRGNIF